MGAVDERASSIGLKRREFLRMTGAAFTAGGFANAQAVNSEERGRRANVIWLIADQHRAQALGCNGDPNVRTPNIDNLARLGVNFTNALSGFPLCCPARGSFLTGRYPNHCVPGHEYPLPPGQPTLTLPLREAGYQTAFFGKWHLDGFHEASGRAAMHIVPPDRRGGFDVWTGYENNNSQYDCWVHGGAGKEAFHYRLPGYETDELTNLLIRYVKERGAEAAQGKTKPFFAVLSVQPPHDPYVAPEKFAGRFNAESLRLRENVPLGGVVEATARRDLAGYYGMIENWDWNIGRVQAALREAALDFDTHLVVLSDHGDMHGSHGMFRKTNPFEESIRVPMIVGGERMKYEGRVNARLPQLFNHVDLAPTTLGLCGIAKPQWMGGTDYSTLRLAGSDAAIYGQAARVKAPAWPDSAYLQNVVPTGHPDSVNRAYRGLVTADGWKYVCLENTPWLLFNLHDDPYELSNLAFNNVYAAERKKLEARLKAWVETTGDRFAVPGD